MGEIQQNRRIKMKKIHTMININYYKLQMGDNRAGNKET